MGSPNYYSPQSRLVNQDMWGLQGDSKSSGQVRLISITSYRGFVFSVREKYLKLDLAQAYQWIEPGGRVKEAGYYNTHKGLYQYNRLPFGVASALAIFQHTMENILKGINNVSVNTDDILVTGRDVAEHLQHLREVLSRVEPFGLILKRDKCAFLVLSVEYLGHRISREGLSPTDDKVKAIKQAPAPCNVTHLRSFLGVLNYYRKFLSSILAPLNSLLQKNTNWSWGSAQANAFAEAKDALSSSQVLAHYNPDLELIVECDAVTV